MQGVEQPHRGSEYNQFQFESDEFRIAEQTRDFRTGIYVLVKGR